MSTKLTILGLHGSVLNIGNAGAHCTSTIIYAIIHPHKKVLQFYIVVCIRAFTGDLQAGRKDVRCFLRAVAHCYAKSVDVELEHTQDTDDSDLDVAQNDTAVQTPTPIVTPRRLRDLPVRRRARADAASVKTTCPVCLTVNCDVAIVPCGHCVCSACMQNITSVAVGSSRCPVCRGDINTVLRLHFAA